MDVNQIVRAVMARYPHAIYPQDFALDEVGGLVRCDLPQTQPTNAELQADVAALDARDVAQKNEANALRQQVISTAQSAVGVSITALTAAQVRALVAILLWKAGAIKADGTVRPLAEWVKE